MSRTLGRCLALMAAALVFAVPGIARAAETPVVRLAGVDRIATAISISHDSFPGASSAGAVVIARADLFPDALAGTPLATRVDAPILLTAPSVLDSRTRAEVSRVLAAGGTVHLLGGPVALSDAVATELTGMGYVVARHGGADRYATAVTIAQAIGQPSAVFLADGTTFADALIAGPAASRRDGAVLLTAGTVVPAVNASYLATIGAVPRWAIGAFAAIADPTATAVVGADRHETSTKVASLFFPGPARIGVADGSAYPDALAGGAHVARLGGPMILVETRNVPNPVEAWLTANAGTIDQAFVYGGTSVVSDEVVVEITALIAPSTA